MELVTSKGASSSLFTHQSKKFNVFLSFRGEDTRRSITSSLYHALCREGIDTFIDNDLKKGDKISDELINIIENSTMSIVIFSENYASSTWCLDELAKIVECRNKNDQLVQPVFYMVEPSYVRYQRGKYKEALIKHEERFKNNVQRWRDALYEAAGYSGWHFKVNDSLTEYDLIQKIVEDTFKSKLNQMPFLATEYEVGIKPRVEALIRRLDIESNDDVHMVAIYGLGGVGKTTMARATYNEISYQFKAKTFLENVRERSETHEGIIRLQEALLNDISRNQNSKVNNVFGGTSMIRDILRLKRVLIILDDVDDADQIKNLLGKCDWFAPGSRIIMTTRNKQLLVNLKKGVSTYNCYDYKVKELDEYKATELFRKHAFPSKILCEDYLELENQVIHYAKGLPLALKVMGVHLGGKPIDEWKDDLDYYEKNPHDDIQKVLKRSYEGLNENEQIIFLDIACFFKGYDMNYGMIKDVLKACGLNPKSGIRKLIDKCLLTIDQDNYLLMHDLLQQMGMDIVRQEAPENPEERSRLWCYEEAFDVVNKNMGSNKIRSIILQSLELEPEEVLLKAQFCKMTNLRLLMIRNICALKSVTNVDFSECELITKIPDLSMTPNIKRLYLRLCKNLVEIDDSVGRLRKLEVWDLAYCFRLRTLPSCLEMNTLRNFNLLGCSSLNRFPEILHEMTGVKILQLPKPIELPPSFGKLNGLTELFFRTTLAVPQYLPGSIHSLQLIERLSLRGNSIFPKDVEIDRQPLCNSLASFSNYVFPSLEQLHLRFFKIHPEKDLILSYCCPLTLEKFYKSKVVTFPESLSRQTLCIRGCDELQEIPRLPQSIIHQMDGDIVQQEALKEHGEHSKLWCYEQALEIVTENMGADKIQSIMLLSPESKPTNVQGKEKKFRKMKNLRLIIGNVPFHGHLEFLPNGFRQLDWDKYPFSSWPSKFYPKNVVVLNVYLNISVGKFNLICAFESVKYVAFSGCKSIRRIPDLSMAPNIECLSLGFCENLVEVDDSVGQLDKLVVWNLTGCSKLETLPRYLTMKSLKYFDIFGCRRLKKFPDILHEMKGVRWLTLRDTGISELPPSFGNLTGLEGFEIGAYSTQFSPLPDSIHNLQHLKTLILEGNFIFPKGFSNYVFPRLKILCLRRFTNRSDVDFIFNCCSLTLEELDIGFCEKIVTLPESISRFERLRWLWIYSCDALQEIPRLPQSIRYVNVSNCHSLDSQSLFHQLREIIGLPPNLPPCLGVTRRVKGSTLIYRKLPLSAY
ncbi:hypothetical protein SO802_013427 [Lithocarpus litseifolius]|uniref:TIR domain-containing protein n=1 Tax=Lithocarpus litseifolius TaxID=425828 RepID=A0AAW2D9N6_9ROSI